MGPHSLSPIAHTIWRGLIAPRRPAWSNSGHGTGFCAQPAWQLNRWERGRAAAMVVALHAAVIALVVLSRSTVSVGATPGLVAFNVAIGGAPRAHRQPARPDHRRLAAHLRLTIPVPQPIAPPAAAADVRDVSPIAQTALQAKPMALGGGCDLTQPVQAALRDSEDLRRQLPAIPADQRSVANAIVVWNAGWIDPDSASAQAAYATIRQTISQRVASASADCRNQLQTGPRLVYLPGPAGKTTVLVLGSGRWNWQQLIDGAQPLPTGTLAEAQPAIVFAPPPAVGRSPDPSPALNALLASLIRNQPSTAAHN